MQNGLTIEVERLEAGIVHVGGGLPSGHTGTLVLELLFCGQVLATAEATPGENQYQARLSLPTETISDGVQTYTIRPRGHRDTVAHITVIAGKVLATDLHAELDQLRTEVELLKKAFRRQSNATGPKP